MLPIGSLLKALIAVAAFQGEWEVLGFYSGGVNITRHGDGTMPFTYTIRGNTFLYRTVVFGAIEMGLAVRPRDNGYGEIDMYPYSQGRQANFRGSYVHTGDLIIIALELDRGAPRPTTFRRPTRDDTHKLILLRRVPERRKQ